MNNPVTWISRKCTIYTAFIIIEIDSDPCLRDTSKSWCHLMQRQHSQCIDQFHSFHFWNPKHKTIWNRVNKHFLELICHGIICVSRATRCKRGTIFLEFWSNHNIFSFLIYWIACLLVESSLIGVGTLLLLTPQFLWRVLKGTPNSLLRDRPRTHL